MTFGSMMRRLLGSRLALRNESQEAPFRKLVEQSPDTICRLVDGKFVYVSPSAAEKFGWDLQSLVGSSGLSTIYEDDQSIILEAIGRLMSGAESRVVTQGRTICGDGSLKWVETTAQIERVGSVTETVLVMRDISERKHLEEELAAMALQDGLTGLSNRRAFDQEFDREWRRTLRTGGEMALVLLDIDFFKQFNDLYGHQAGDDCLRTVAACVRECAVRPADIACRYGGEEIVVICSPSAPMAQI